MSAGRAAACTAIAIAAVALPSSAWAADPPPEPITEEQQEEPIEVTVREEPRPVDTTTVTRAEARTLPGAFGDPFRVLESVPSVVPIVSGVPYFYVRGAPPGNIGYFLDGIRVPLLFHLGLGPSVLHPALIDRVEVTPGPSPELGRYAGGVVSGTLTKEREDFRVEGNLRAVDTGAFVEAPFDGGRGAALAAGRISYTALLFSVLSPSIILDYWDYAGRASYEVSPGHRLTVFGFGAYDHLGEKSAEPDTPDTLLVKTMFHRVKVGYDVETDPNTRYRYGIVLGWDQTDFDEEREVIDRMLNVTAQMTSRIDDDLQVLAGVDLLVDDYEIDLDRGGGSGFETFFGSRTDVAAGAYVVLPWNPIERLAVRPGLRADVHLSGEDTAFAIDPSLSMRLGIIPGLALLTNIGSASQMPSFIVAGPGFRPALDGGALQRSFTSSAAVEWRPDEEWTFKVGGYRSWFWELNDALGTSGLAEEGFPEGFDEFDGRFSGTSTGLELSVKRRMSSRIGAVVTYSFGRSEREDDRGRSFPSGFDRTHVATAALSYDFGSGYRAGMKHVLYTGAPLLDVDGDDVDVKKRLPPYYRMDWRFEKRWTIGKRGFVSVVAEVLNTFLAAETLGEECETPEGGATRCSPTKLGPVTIPSIGVEGGY